MVFDCVSGILYYVSSKQSTLEHAVLMILIRKHICRKESYVAAFFTTARRSSRQSLDSKQRNLKTTSTVLPVSAPQAEEQTILQSGASRSYVPTSNVMF
jgi:hypothetical protein